MRRTDITSSRSLFPLCIAILVALLSVESAHAHGVKLFAAAKGGTIQGTAAFADGKPLPDAEIVVFDGDGTPLSALTTDADGRFDFPFENDGVYTLELKTPDGHGAKFTVDAQSNASPDSGGSHTSDPDLVNQITELRQDIARLEDTTRFRDVIGGIGYIIGIIGLMAFFVSRKPEA